VTHPFTLLVDGRVQALDTYQIKYSIDECEEACATNWQEQ
jgi:hypothetical protein